MCRPSRWWLGLAPLAALLLAALLWRTPQVEADVAANARAALLAKGVIEPAVAVAGRDVRLAGLTSGAADAARAAAQAAAGVRLVEDGLKPLPTRAPYAISLQRAGEGVSLSGYVPDPASRAALVQAAGGLGKVRDDLVYAAGAPQSFAAMTGAALATLAPLSVGSATITDGALRVAGQAPDAGAYDKALAAAAALPAGLKLAAFDVIAPATSPYLFSANRDGPSLTVSGYAPDLGARERLMEAARHAAPMVAGDLKLVAGAPQGFEAMAKAALSAVAPLPRAQASLNGTTLSLTGEAAERIGYEQARAALAQPPAGLTVARLDILAPPLAPYPFAATKAGERVALSGAAPDEATRARLIAAAGAGGRTVEDGLTIARGAGPAFERQALAAVTALAPLSAGEASLSDQSLRLAGEAPDAAARERALAAARAPGLTLTGAEVTLAAPAGLDARRDGDAITLSGRVPSTQVRDALIAAARPLAGTVVDHMTVGSGPEAGFLPAAKAAVEALRHVSQGEAKLAGDALVVSATLAPGERAAQATRGVEAAAPKGLTTRFDWRYPVARPFVFEAGKGADGAVTLGGHAPDEASLAAVEASARDLAREGGGRLNGAATPASGLSPKIAFGRLADFGFSLLNRAPSGWMKIGDDGLSFGATAPPAEAEALRAALARSGLPLGRVEIAATEAPAPVVSAPVVSAPVAPPAPVETPAAPAKPVDPVVAACHAQILAQLAEETIEFSSGSARLAPQSTGLIRKLADVIKSCPQADLEVAGHTDNVGGDERNLELSRRRAEAVVQALAGAGAPADRLSAAGYGESRPLVANDTPEGRARNRRIEFVLK